jgi:hypothetical protein
MCLRQQPAEASSQGPPVEPRTHLPAARRNQAGAHTAVRGAALAAHYFATYPSRFRAPATSNAYRLPCFRTRCRLQSRSGFLESRCPRSRANRRPSRNSVCRFEGAQHDQDFKSRQHEITGHCRRPVRLQVCARRAGTRQQSIRSETLSKRERHAARPTMPGSLGFPKRSRADNESSEAVDRYDELGRVHERC